MDKQIVDKICKCSSLNIGWHGNPDSHTLEITLYFGKKDPREFFKPDKYGHAKVTRELLEFFAK